MTTEERVAYKEKLRSITVGLPSKRTTKTTTDVHDAHTVDVTEHWAERVDVKVTLNQPQRMSADD